MKAAVIIGIFLALGVLGAGMTQGGAEEQQPAVRTDAVPATPLRRLTRVEYLNSLRDIFGVDFKFMDELPADGQAGGFDNNSDALALTPLLLEKYLKVARKASDLVLGTGSKGSITHSVTVDSNQSGWVEGLPMSTRGGVRIEHYFPHDGEYEIRAFLDYMLAGGKRLSSALKLAPVENARFFKERIAVSAGTHILYITFPNTFAMREGAVPNLPSAVGAPGLGGPLDIQASAIKPELQFWLDGKKIKTFAIEAPDPGYETTFNAQPGPPILGVAEISGPVANVATGDTAARRDLMICQPRRPSDERACAARILKRVARTAYRRDVDENDMGSVLAAFDRKRPGNSFEQAIGMGLMAILMSPDFLFRIERAAVVSQAELATRLSYFLWSSSPDDNLRDAARRGRLTGARLDAQVRRMLADNRADALVDNFAAQWLDLRSLNSIRPDARTYPEYETSLTDLYRTETRLFLRDMMRQNRSVLEVISSDYTYLNERLAKLYGIGGVVGPSFRKVALRPEDQRGGVISQASVLMMSSHPAQTSPILRGKWILTNLMNAPPPLPPAGVPALDMGPAPDGRKLTTREQIERHRSSPVCASCHSKMDPYGVALENYDVMGRWRTEEDGLPLDTTTALPRGEPFTGPAGLKQVLLARDKEFATATVSRLMAYALGRELNKADKATAQQIADATKPDGYRFADIVLAIVRSAPFQTRLVENPQP